nr:b(0,+)-type amino acid transporter 1-like [Ciona intestinalis]|eukprot:XP_009862520.2 b(0,+)-type amino acid transporter 1-like [Ciona intestinalis]
MNQDDGSTKFELKKKIGFFASVALVAGMIVGAGIFISPTGVLRSVNGSVGLSLVIWVVCGLVAMCSSLCYCELGTMLKASGGDFTNFNLAFGPAFSFVYIWSSIAIYPGGPATLLIFARYLSSPFYPIGCNPPESVIKLFAISLAFVLIYVNCRSVTGSVYFQLTCTAAKFLAMLVIATGGIVVAIQGNPVATHNFQHAFDSSDFEGLTVPDIGRACYQGLFAYNGWHFINSVTEEISNVQRTLPRASIVSVVLVMTVYLLVNIGYFSVLTVEEMLSSKALAVVFANKILGSFAWIIPVSVCISIVGSQNGGYLLRARLPFVAARDGNLPKIFGMIHVDHYTPVPANLLNGGIIIFLIILGDFDALIYIQGSVFWSFYGLSAVSLLVLRHKMPNLHRPYKVPIFVPILTVVFSLYFVIAPLVHDPSPIYLFPVCFYITSLIIYYVFVVKKLELPGSDVATKFIQKLLKVAETDWEGGPFNDKR